MVNKMETTKENLEDVGENETKWQKWAWVIRVRRISQWDFISSIGKIPTTDDQFGEAYLTRMLECPWDPHYIGEEYPIIESPYTGPLFIDDPKILAEYGLPYCKVAKLKIINGKVVDVKPVA